MMGGVRSTGPVPTIAWRRHDIRHNREDAIVHVLPSDIRKDHGDTKPDRIDRNHTPSTETGMRGWKRERDIRI